MKNFWIFGDSFTAPPNKNGWGQKLAKKLYRNPKHRGFSGASNYQILLTIINHLSDIKSHDILLVNWSFLTRGVLFTKDGMVSTNRFYYDEGKSFNTPGNLESHEIVIKNTYINSLNYLLENSNQENSMVFRLAQSLQSYFEEKEVRMVSVFLEKDWLTSNDMKIKWPENNFELNELNFEPDYFTWLKNNDYLGDSELDTHYKDNISDIIANEYYKRLVSVI